MIPNMSELSIGGNRTTLVIPRGSRGRVRRLSARAETRGVDDWSAKIETRLRAAVAAAAAGEKKREEEESALTADQRQQLQREAIQWRTDRQNAATLASSEMNEPPEAQDQDMGWAKDAEEAEISRRAVLPTLLCVSSDIEGGPNALLLTQSMVDHAASYAKAHRLNPRYR